MDTEVIRVGLESCHLLALVRCVCWTATTLRALPVWLPLHVWYPRVFYSVDVPTDVLSPASHLRKDLPRQRHMTILCSRRSWMSR